MSRDFKVLLSLREHLWLIRLGASEHARWKFLWLICFVADLIPNLDFNAASTGRLMFKQQDIIEYSALRNKQCRHTQIHTHSVRQLHGCTHPSSCLPGFRVAIQMRSGYCGNWYLRKAGWGGVARRCGRKVRVSLADFMGCVRRAGGSLDLKPTKRKEQIQEQGKEWITPQHPVHPVCSGGRNKTREKQHLCY